MKKLSLFVALAIGTLALATEMRTQGAVMASMAPDIPPPDCWPDCPAR